MEHLNPREKRILTMRRLAETPLTLEELSQEFGVSRERVRQIEVPRLREDPEGDAHGGYRGRARDGGGPIVRRRPSIRRWRACSG